MYMSPGEEHHAPDTNSEDITPDLSVGEQCWVVMCINTVCGFIVQCILGYPIIQILVYQNSQKLVNFHEFYYNNSLQDGGHLVMWSVFQPPVCYLISSH